MIEYVKEGELHLVTMNDGPNTICPQWQTRMLEILDAVEEDCRRGASFVLTGVDKFFSNGLNLEVVMRLSQGEMSLFSKRMMEIHRRLVILPCPTVAALNGHAFAGGGFLALSCDYRVMREDRGWFCLSEVDVGVPIAPGLMGLLRDKLTPNTARDAILTGRRYTAGEAIAAGIVDIKAPEKELLNKAIELANQLATKEPDIFRTLKQNWLGPVAEALV